MNAPHQGPGGRERRYFPRVNYRAHATLTTTHGRHEVHLLDVSFNGALVALIEPHPLSAGEEVVVNIDMNDGEMIKMQGKLAHQQDHYLGIECRATTIDNQSKLRELLNSQPEAVTH